MKNKLKGLSLVEVIIVVMIIATLVLVAIAYFRGQIFKGNDAKKKSDMNRIGIAVEEYEKDHDCYPLTQDVVCNPGTGLQPYLDRIPCDPTTKASYFYEHQDSSCPGWYRIYTKLDSQSDSSATPGIGPGGTFDFVYSSPNSPALSVGTPPPAGGGGGSGGSGGSGGEEITGFYGCRSGACVPINWDSTRPGPECDPNYQNSTCYNQCGVPNNECTSWH